MTALDAESLVYGPQECRESIERQERSFQAQLAKERAEAGR